MDTENKEKIASQKKADYMEFALFLILGFLVGIVIKTEASKRITIGHDDYRISTNEKFYSLNSLQSKLREEAAKEKQGSGQNPGANSEQGTAEGAETSR